MKSTKPINPIEALIISDPKVILSGFDLLFFLDISRTVLLRLARKPVLVCLEGEGVEYLHCHTEVYGPK